MKFWLSCAVMTLVVFALAMSGINEYLFFAGFVILQFIILATAWNILGGYAGYVNFGVPAFVAVGAYTAVVLLTPIPAPLTVQSVGGAILAGALGPGVGWRTLQLRRVVLSSVPGELLFLLDTGVPTRREVWG